MLESKPVKATSGSVCCAVASLKSFENNNSPHEINFNSRRGKYIFAGFYCKQVIDSSTLQIYDRLISRLLIYKTLINVA